MKTLTRFANVAALLSLMSAWNLAAAADGKDVPPKDAAKEALDDGDFKISPPYTDAPVWLWQG